MEFRTAIYWHQGLFLQPQHLQRQELHQHFLRQSLFSHVAPHFWGVGEWLVTPETLAARTLEVRRARLLFRDGTYVEIPGNGVIPTRAFDRLWTNPDEPLPVSLGLKKFSNTRSNVTVVESFNEVDTVTTRFASEANGEPTPDFYGDGPQADIPVLTHVVRLFLGPETESLDEYDVIPLGALVRDNDNVRWQTDRVPPCYALSGSATLRDITRDIRDDLTGRMRQLAEYKVPHDAAHQDLDADFLLLMQSLQTLNHLVPALTHLTETETVHPWRVYGLLRQCVGELSTFSSQVDALGETTEGSAGLPAYDHLHLYDCFHAARRLINQLLSEISAGPEFRVTLTPLDDYLAGAIPRDYFAPRNRFYLVLQVAQAAEGLGARFLQGARVAAPAALPTIIDHALPGIDMIEVATPPQGMPKRANAYYFRIEQLSNGWEQIEQAAEIGLYWPDAPDDLRAQLIVLRG